jgi:hypothetical protein
MTIVKEQPFKEAELHWDLERLLNDLADVNKKPLTFTEQLTLRGLLCGYTPAELAKMRTKNKEGQRTNVSRGVGSYVKKLMKAKGCEVPKRMNSVEMLNMLKKVGYNKAVTDSTDEKEKALTINVEGPVRVTRVMKEFIHIEIEKLGVTLSAEQLGELVNTVVSGDDEKKQLVNTLINLVKTVVGK